MPAFRSAHHFLAQINKPLLFKLFLLRQLPAAFLAGLRVIKAATDHCTVVVPFGWLTQNPFRSTYFASQSMAAEMSTGILAMAAVYDQPVRVSMLIVRSEGEYLKKATGTTYFTCQEGDRIAAAVAEAVQTGLPVTFTGHSEGKNAAGETISYFSFTWSFKASRGR